MNPILYRNTFKLILSRELMSCQELYKGSSNKNSPTSGFLLTESNFILPPFFSLQMDYKHWLCHSTQINCNSWRNNVFIMTGKEQGQPFWGSGADIFPLGTVIHFQYNGTHYLSSNIWILAWYGVECGGGRKKRENKKERGGREKQKRLWLFLSVEAYISTFHSLI